ncbi:MAG: YggT family protein [Devosia sp.]
MGSILELVLVIIRLYTWVVIASVVFSWLYAFNVINSRNQIVNTIGRALYQLTEPVLGPIRRVLPNMGGLDLSPLVLLLGLFFLQTLIARNFAAIAY